MIFTVTGCAGFIGSNLVKSLLNSGHRVIGIDNFSTGKREFLNGALNNPNFILYPFDLLRDKKFIPRVIDGSDCVFHLSANADVKDGLSHPEKDVEQNIIVTHNVLEGMRLSGVKKIVFSSTGSVYGENVFVPTPESCRLDYQTSLYSASKLSCEALIQAYCKGFDFTSYIFRFVSVLGRNYHHGHVIDFYNQLKTNPNKLTVLGNGYQTKSYMSITDCISGISTGLYNGKEKINVFNLGRDECITVRDSIKTICDYLKVNPEIEYTGGKNGWVGDNPIILLDICKIRALGWRPQKSIRASICETLDYLKERDEQIKE